jgi:hypothetical protein
MRLDPRLRIRRALGMIDIPQSGNPPWAEEIIQFLDFFGQFHGWLLGKVVQPVQIVQAVQSVLGKALRSGPFGRIERLERLERFERF